MKIGASIQLLEINWFVGILIALVANPKSVIIGANCVPTNRKNGTPIIAKITILSVLPLVKI